VLEDSAGGTRWKRK